jgi:hypothetical protein
MSLLFDLEALGRGGIDAIQHGQRDFSPYLMHLTSHRAMGDVRTALAKAASAAPKNLQALVDSAVSLPRFPGHLP